MSLLGLDSETQLIGDAASMAPRSKAIIANYAKNLHKHGHLCIPSCLQKCGKLILSDESTAAGIVTCFKKDCGCHETVADGEGDAEKLMRFQ